MGKFFPFGLRARLMLLVLTAVLPALGLALYDAYEQRQLALRNARAETLQIARRAVTMQERLIDAAYQQFVVIAQLPILRDADITACNLFLADFLKANSHYNNLAVIDLRGNVQCSALPFSAPVNIGALAHFQRALSTRDFALGDYQIGRISGKASLPLAYPIFDSQGALRAVLTGGLDLENLAPIAMETPLPPASMLLVIDQNRTRIAQFPARAAQLGAPETDPAVARLLTLLPTANTLEAQDSDGVARLYAITPLHGVHGQTLDVYVIVNIPTAVAFANVDQIVNHHLQGLGVVALLALGAAWLFGELFIVRRTRALLAATQRLAAGDFSARMNQPYGVSELSELGRAFDRMAETIQQRVAEQQQFADALARRETETAKLLDNLPGYVFLQNTEGVYITANQAYCQLLGRSLVEIVGKTDYDLLPPAHADRIHAEDAQMLATGEAMSVGEVEINQGAHRLTVFTRKVPLRDRAGAIIGLLGLSVDVTERKTIEEILRRQTAELEAITRVSRDIIRVPALNQVLASIARLTAELTQADASGVYIPDATGVLRLAASYGVSDEFVQAITKLGILPNQGALGRAVVARQPVQISDVLADPNYAFTALAQLGNIRAILAAPMFRDDQIVGGIVLWRRQAHHFSPEEVSFLQAIAQQCINAIENARLFDAEREQRELAEALRDAAAALSGTLDFDELLDCILENVGRVVPHDLATIMLIENDLARVVRSRHPDATDFRALEDVLVVAETVNLKQMLETGKPLVIDDVNEFPGWVHTPQTLWIRAHLGTLIRVKGQVIGFLNVDSATPGFFNATHLARLQAFADQAAVALENARLLTETRQRADQFAALYATSRDIAAQRDLGALLETVVARALRITHAEHGGLYLYDPVRGDLELVVQHGYPVGVGTRLRLGEGMAGRVAQLRQPIIVDDYQTWEYRTNKFDSVPFAAVIQVPLLFGGELVGVLSIAEIGAATRRFREDDERVLSLFASQVASAVRNARLLQEARARAEQLALLYDAGLVLNSVLEPRTQLEFLAKLAAQVVHADRASFFRYDAVAREMRLEVSIGYAPESAARLQAANQRMSDPSNIVGWIAENRVPANLPNVTADPRYVAVDSELRAGLWLPVEHEQQLLGVFGVLSKRPAAFRPEDERMLALFANQAAVALENTRLVNELQLSVHVLTRLSELSTQLLAAVTFEETVRCATQILRATFNMQAAWIHLFDAQGKLEASAGDGIAELQATDLAPRPNGLSAQVWRSGVLRIVTDPQELHPAARAHGVQAAIVIPLRSEPHNLGVLFLDYATAHHFTERELELITLFANQIALAIKRVRLGEETRRQLERLAVLNRIASAVNQAQHLDEFLQIIQREISAVFRYDAISIALYDPNTRELDFRVMIDEGMVLPPTKHPLGTGLNARVITEQCALRVMDWEQEQTQLPSPVVWGTLRTPRSWLGVPMQMNGRVIGLIKIEAYQPNQYGAEEEQLLSTITDQVAVAIQKLRLFEETQQRLAELEAVNRLSVALRAVSTPAAMLPVLLDIVLDVIGTPAGAVIAYPSEDSPSAMAARGWFNTQAMPALSLRNGVGAQIFKTGEPYRVHDFQTDPLIRESALPVVPGWSGVIAPIRSAQAPIGLLIVATPLPREIQPPETRLLTTIADLAGNAIHRVVLHAQTERRLNRLNALHAIDTAISASFDLRVTLNILLDQVLVQLQVDAADVLLCNPAAQTFDCLAAQGFHSNVLTRRAVRFGEGYPSRVMFERRSVHLPRLPQTPDDPRAALLQEEGFVTYYALPLMPKGQIKGVLEIFLRTFFQPDVEWLEFLETLAGQTAIAFDNATLFTSLQRSNVELSLAYDATIEGWSRALDLRDKETEGHTQRVTEMALRLARAMGMNDADLANIRRGALLHDIGKMGISDRILLKPGSLTAPEMEVMRRHPQYAYELLAPIEYLRGALDIPYCHHEKWDGTGYPRGLAGETIPLAARIFAAVDVWDALRSDRSYRRAWPAEQVTAYIQSLAGTHFDPRIVSVFMQILREEQTAAVSSPAR